MGFPKGKAHPNWKHGKSHRTLKIYDQPKLFGCKRQWAQPQIQEMIKLYSLGHGSQDIAKVFGCSDGTIRYQLRRSGVAIRKRGVSTPIGFEKIRGPNNYAWKGGWHLHKRTGYILVQAPGHPYAKGNGTLAQHRYVMEKYLREQHPEHPALDQNGYLLPYWSVHHKNGIKTDNRIENLEVMPRTNHSPWIHYMEELERLRRQNAELKATIEQMRSVHS